MLRITSEAVEDEAPALQMSLDELVREGARRMLLQALKLEVADYVDRRADRGERAGVWWCETARDGGGK